MSFFGNSGQFGGGWNNPQFGGNPWQSGMNSGQGPGFNNPWGGNQSPWSNSPQQLPGGMGSGQSSSNPFVWNPTSNSYAQMQTYDSNNPQYAPQPGPSITEQNMQQLQEMLSFWLMENMGNFGGQGGGYGQPGQWDLSQYGGGGPGGEFSASGQGQGNGQYGLDTAPEFNFGDPTNASVDPYNMQNYQQVDVADVHEEVDPMDVIRSQMPAIHSMMNRNFAQAGATMGQTGMTGTAYTNDLGRAAGEAAAQIGGLYWDTLGGAAERKADRIQQQNMLEAQFAHQGQLDDLRRQYDSWRDYQGMGLDATNMNNQWGLAYDQAQSQYDYGLWRDRYDREYTANQADRNWDYQAWRDYNQMGMQNTDMNNQWDLAYGQANQDWQNNNLAQYQALWNMFANLG